MSFQLALIEQLEGGGGQRVSWRGVRRTVRLPLGSRAHTVLDRQDICNSRLGVKNLHDFYMSLLRRQIQRSLAIFALC